MVRAERLPKKAQNKLDQNAFLSVKSAKLRAQSAYKGERTRIVSACKGSTNQRPQSGFSNLRFSNVTTDAGGAQHKAALRPNSPKSGQSTHFLNQSSSSMAWATRKSAIASHRTKPESKDNLQIDSFLGGLGRLGSANNKRNLVRP